MAGARPVSICHSKQQLSGKHIPSSKSYSLLAQTITEKMEPSDKDYWRKFVKKLCLVPIAKDRELSVRVKMHQFFKIFTTIHLISFWSLLDDHGSSICLKYFLNPTKTLPLPSCIFNVPSLRFFQKIICDFHVRFKLYAKSCR